MIELLITRRQCNKDKNIPWLPSQQHSSKCKTHFSCCLKCRQFWGGIFLLVYSTEQQGLLRKGIQHLIKIAAGFQGGKMQLLVLELSQLGLIPLSPRTGMWSYYLPLQDASKDIIVKRVQRQQTGYISLSLEVASRGYWALQSTAAVPKQPHAFFLLDAWSAVRLEETSFTQTWNQR